ncbi:MAG: beta-lactamase family protein, partial [Bdellovibrionaceae bacterium]|nr:beta-lactamase family protein [Pseudobdellovibrionaceae bacterium]
MSAYEKRLQKKIGDSWIGSTPGFVLQVHDKGRLKADLAFGKTYRYYDWASLTKIVFSVTQVMALVDEGKISLQRPVEDELDWFRSPVPHARVREILCHSAGLSWWRPFYKSLDRSRSRSARWEQLERLVAREMKNAANSKYDGKAVYSDLDFFTLGALMRRKTGQEFDEMWGGIR